MQLFPCEYNQEKVNKQIERFELLNLIHEIKISRDTKLIQPLLTNPIFSRELKENLEQIGLAISDQYFNKWGKRYLPSIFNANKFEERQNLRDQITQKYALK